MRLLLTACVWLLCLLHSLATPIVNTRDDTNVAHVNALTDTSLVTVPPITGTNVTTVDTHLLSGSIQIFYTLYEQHGKWEHYWSIFAGKKGKACQPCQDSDFLMQTGPWTNPIFDGTDDRDNMPWIKLGVKMSLPNGLIMGLENCVIQGDTDNPALLDCRGPKGSLTYPFDRDPQWKDPAIPCGKPHIYKRAWSVEFEYSWIVNSE